MSSPAFWRGVEEFNQQQFYACHDTIEAIWLEAPEIDRRFYQGILQVAVGCYHLSNYNWRGAVMLLGEGVRRLRDYQPDYLGIDVEHLLQQSYHLLQSLQQIEPEQVGVFCQQLQAKAKTDDSSSEASVSPNSSQWHHRELDLTDGCQLPHIVRVG